MDQQAPIKATHGSAIDLVPSIRGTAFDLDGVQPKIPAPARTLPLAPPSPPKAETDFEKYVEDTTGHFLPMFGRDLFTHTPMDFLPATSLSPPSDYIVGSGDQVKVRAWDGADLDVLTTVDRNGQIFVPQIGTMSVAGATLSELQQIVHSAVSKQFRDFKISVTLGQLRSIQVFVVGQAKRPGIYTVSSLSTLINALFTSGGPSDAGSLRDIQVKRSGQVLTHFDVYDFLLAGDKRKDLHLLAGDTIFIPFVGPQIAIDGDVTKPGIYELRGNTTAESALQLAGGLTAVAGTERASINRIVDHSRRIAQDFALTGAQNLIQVQGGDVFQVFPISAKLSQAVVLRGNIASPGSYAWHEGMRVSDLIPSREALLNRSFYNRQNALLATSRDHPFAVAAPAEGVRRTRTNALPEELVAASSSSGEAAVTEVAADFVDHDTEVDWTYAAVERLDASTLKTNMLTFPLGEALDHPGSAANLQLEAGDIVVIYTRNDINLPQELRSRYVRIDGEVTRPGVYQLEKDETLREVVQRAGGIAPHGYPYAAQLTRESERVAEELKLRAIVREESRDALSPANSPRVSSDARGSGNELQLRQAYIAALSQMHATGRITLQISPTLEGPDALPELTLQDGDHFFVPARPNTVDVLGSVYNQGPFRYLSAAHLEDYLRAAGGPTAEADQSRDYLLRADGTVLSRKQFSRFGKLVVYPGDTLVVPARLRPSFGLYDLVNLSQALTGSALTALAIKSIQ